MKTILVDFDNVIYSYESGWKGATELPDPPHTDALSFLYACWESKDIEAVIWTSRVHDDVDGKAEAAIRTWLHLHGLSREVANSLKITNSKPPAVLIIDDRAFKFEGYFPNLDFIRNFQPWPKDED